MAASKYQVRYTGTPSEDWCGTFALVADARRFAERAVAPATLARKEEWIGMTDIRSK